jgi:hypothetical protein
LARTTDEVVRIQLRAGSITRTAIPGLDSGGPVSFVVGAHAVIILPIDVVPGYFVADGEVAQPVSGRLDKADGGYAFPGPDGNHLWITVGPGGNQHLELVSFDGMPAGFSIPLPSIAVPVASDGTGDVLVDTSNGISLARPDGLSQLAGGTLLAAGPSRWLSNACDHQRRCNTFVTDRATGRRRTLGASQRSPDFPFPPGVISPDGTTAALTSYAPGGSILHLLDLTSGHDQAIPVEPFRNDGSEGSIVWSPDSRWLFVVDNAKQIEVIDRQHLPAHPLDANLPAIEQLGFRTH